MGAVNRIVSFSIYKVRQDAPDHEVGVEQVKVVSQEHYWGYPEVSAKGPYYDEKQLVELVIERIKHMVNSRQDFDIARPDKDG